MTDIWRQNTLADVDFIIQNAQKYLPKQHINTMMAKLKLLQKMTKKEQYISVNLYYFLIQGLVAGIQDDHTAFLFHDGIYQNLLINDIVFKYGNGVYYEHCENHNIQVTEIDDIPAEIQLKKIMDLFCNPAYSRDVNLRMATMFLSIQNPLLPYKTYTLLQKTGRVTFKFEWKRNQKNTDAVQQAYKQALFRYPINETPTTDIQYIQPINSILLTLNQGFMEIETFEKLVLSKMNQMPNIQSVMFVIIDLRNNSGGLVDTEVQVLQSMVDQRFQDLIRETSGAKFSGTLNVKLFSDGKEIYKQICKDRFKNKGPKVIIITNPRCYSACVSLIKSTKSLPYVIHIGRQTSKFEMNGNATYFPSPSGQGQLLIATYQETTRQYKYAPINYDIPDIELPFNIVQSRENLLLWISQNQRLILEKMRIKNKKLIKC